MSFTKIIGPPRLRAIAPTFGNLSDAELQSIHPPRLKAITTGMAAAGYQPREQKQVALFEYVGPVTKQRSINLADQLAVAREDGTVSEGLLIVSSYGGDVAGTDDLAESVKRFAAVKRLTCYIDDACCSAALCFACEATEMICTPAATVGSIGVFLALLDMSKAFERDGLQVVVVRSGEAKGARIDGLKIEQSELDRLQVVVDTFARLFMARVAHGRKMTAARVAELATGDVWIGTAAKAVGLVDRVAYLPDVLREIAIRNAPTPLEIAVAEQRAVAAAEQARKAEYENDRRVRRSLGMHVG